MHTGLNYSSQLSCWGWKCKEMGDSTAGLRGKDEQELELGRAGRAGRAGRSGGENVGGGGSRAGWYVMRSLSSFKSSKN